MEQQPRKVSIFAPHEVREQIATRVAYLKDSLVRADDEQRKAIEAEIARVESAAEVLPDHHAPSETSPPASRGRP